MIFSGCTRNALHMARFSGTGVFFGLFDPDHALPFDESWSLFLGDRLEAASGVSTLLFGERLRQKISRIEGTTNLSPCRDVRCALDRARIVQARYLLTATLRREGKTKRTVTLGYWAVSPPRLMQSLTRDLPESDQKNQDLAVFLDRLAKDFLNPSAVQNGAKNVGPDTNPGSAVEKLLDQGQVDQALRLGERLNRTLPASKKTAEFNLALLRTYRASGLMDEARKLVSSVMKNGAINSDFVLEAANMYRSQGFSAEKVRGLYYQGLMRLPDARYLWGKVMEDRIWRGHPRQALSMLSKYRQTHPGAMDDRMTGVYYAANVFSGNSQKADVLWTKEYTSRKHHRTLLARHAWLYRQAEEGHLRKVRSKARNWIRAGFESEAIYRDLMVALGGLGEPIEEVHTGREAIRKGFASDWIKNRVLALEAKGY
jgi:hypothetical protein